MKTTVTDVAHAIDYIERMEHANGVSIVPEEWGPVALSRPHEKPGKPQDKDFVATAIARMIFDTREKFTPEQNQEVDRLLKERFRPMQ